MLQGKAIQDHFMSLRLQNSRSKKDADKLHLKPLKLQLPRNWYNDFSGFLIRIDKLVDNNSTIRIIIKQDTSMDYQPADCWEKLDEALEYDSYMKVAMVGYVSFGSLRHTSWWNSVHTKILFFLETARFKVSLVPRKSKGASIEGAKRTTDCSEFWDKVDEGEGDKTFEIQHDSKSSIEILWSH